MGKSRNNNKFRQAKVSANKLDGTNNEQPLILSIDANNIQQWLKVTARQLTVKYGEGAAFTGKSGKWYVGERPVRHWRIAGSRVNPNVAAVGQTEDIDADTEDGGSENSSVTFESSLKEVTAEEAVDLEFEYKEAVKLFVKEEHELKKLKPKIYEDIMSRLSDQSIAKVREASNYDAIEARRDVVELWKRIKYTHVNRVTGVEQEDFIIALQSVINISQHKAEDITKYKDRFDGLCKIYAEVCKTVGATVLSDTLLVACFVRGLGPNFADYKKSVTNNAVQKVKDYPRTVGVAYEEASNWRVTVQRTAEGSMIPEQGQLFIAASLKSNKSDKKQQKGVDAPI